MRGFLGRVLIGALAGGLLALAGVALLADENLDEPPPAEGPKLFVVEDNRILAPDGGRFVVKGVTIPYGTFAGGDREGLGARNYRTAGRDFSRLERLGVNLVRVLVKPSRAASDQTARLRRVVRLARARGFVVQLSPAFTTIAGAEALLGSLAREYRGDSHVWLQTSKDPNCVAGRVTRKCGDWTLWQRQQKRLIAAIRKAGVRSPVVVNTPGYSAGLDRISSFPLDDENVVYGVHRYPTTDRSFTEADRLEERRKWADRGLDQAVVVDEVGGAAPGLKPVSDWAGGFLDFVSSWVETGGGAGAIGFVWHWSDSNSMTDPEGRLTDWGRLFVDRYLGDPRS